MCNDVVKISRWTTSASQMPREATALNVTDRLPNPSSKITIRIPLHFDDESVLGTLTTVKTIYIYIFFLKMYTICIYIIGYKSMYVFVNSLIIFDIKFTIHWTPSLNCWSLRMLSIHSSTRMQTMWMIQHFILISKQLH